MDLLIVGTSVGVGVNLCACATGVAGSMAVMTRRCAGCVEASAGDAGTIGRGLLCFVGVENAGSTWEGKPAAESMEGGAKDTIGIGRGEGSSGAAGPLESPEKGRSVADQ
mmetsp:Transcript_31750/g.74476  ORF Transcript_31750/g.74476 Transcript_31750/m.74476 type:complete len:110 (-) Transcript_31750:920-1249(-)